MSKKSPSTNRVNHNLFSNTNSLFSPKLLFHCSLHHLSLDPLLLYVVTYTALAPTIERLPLPRPKKVFSLTFLDIIALLPTTKMKNLSSLAVQTLAISQPLPPPFTSVFTKGLHHNLCFKYHGSGSELKKGNLQNYERPPQNPTTRGTMGITPLPEKLQNLYEWEMAYNKNNNRRIKDEYCEP